MITKVTKSGLSGPSTYFQDEEKACWKVRAVEKYLYDILPRWRKSMFKVRAVQTLNKQYCTSVLGQKHFHFSFPNHDYWLRMIMLTIMIYIFLETFAPNATFFIIWTFRGGQQPTHTVQKAVVVKHWEKAKHQLKRNMKLKRTHWDGSDHLVDWISLPSFEFRPSSPDVHIFGRQKANPRLRF